MLDAIVSLMFTEVCKASDSGFQVKTIQKRPLGRKKPSLIWSRKLLYLCDDNISEKTGIGQENVSHLARLCIFLATATVIANARAAAWLIPTGRALNARPARFTALRKGLGALASLNVWRKSRNMASSMPQFAKSGA